MKRRITLSSRPRWAATTAAEPAAATCPDVGCMQAGIRKLQGAGLLDDVARGGIAIETAVSLGVSVRRSCVSGVPNPIPLWCCSPTTGPVGTAPRLPLVPELTTAS